MKHAPILILDDSVSAVDTKTERTILDNLKKREGLTTILIAHRISSGGADGQDRVRRGRRSPCSRENTRICTGPARRTARWWSICRNLILWVGAIIGVISTLLIVAAFVVKDGEKKPALSGT